MAASGDDSRPARDPRDALERRQLGARIGRRLRQQPHAFPAVDRVRLRRALEHGRHVLPHQRLGFAVLPAARTAAPPPAAARAPPRHARSRTAPRRACAATAPGRRRAARDGSSRPPRDRAAARRRAVPPAGGCAQSRSDERSAGSAACRRASRQSPCCRYSRARPTLPSARWTLATLCRMYERLTGSFTIAGMASAPSRIARARSCWPRLRRMLPRFAMSPATAGSSWRSRSMASVRSVNRQGVGVPALVPAQQPDAAQRVAFERRVAALPAHAERGRQRAIGGVEPLEQGRDVRPAAGRPRPGAPTRPPAPAAQSVPRSTGSGARAIRASRTAAPA